MGINYIVCDLTDSASVKNLVAKLEYFYKDLSILVNNAGLSFTYKLGERANAVDKARAEFETNYFAPVRLAESLMPLLKKQEQAAIVNITANVAFHPMIVLPTYSDSKAALHSHSVALRLTLSSGTRIKVFEVLPSQIPTNAIKEVSSNQNCLSPMVVARNIYNGLQEDRYELYIGDAGKQHADYLSDPKAAIAKLNQAPF